MPQANRTVKLSVYKDGALLQEASFTQPEILVGAFARADLRIDDPETFEMRHLRLRVSDAGVEAENLAGEGRLLFEGAEVEGRADVSKGGKLAVGPYELLLTVRVGEAGKPDGFYAASSNDKKRQSRGIPALEIAMFWEGTLFAVNHYKKPRTVTVGEGKSADYFAPGEQAYPLVVPHRGRHAVNFSSDVIEGDVLVGDKVYSVAEMKAAGLLTDGNRLVLDGNTRCRLRIDNVSYLISDTTVPVLPTATKVGNDSIQSLIYLGLSAIIHLALIVVILYSPVHRRDADVDPVEEMDDKMNVLKMAEEEKEKEEEEKEEEELETAGDEAEEDGTEKADTKTDKTDRPKPKVAKDLPSTLTRTTGRARDEKIARSTGLSKAFQESHTFDFMNNPTMGSWGGSQRGAMLITSAGADGKMVGGYYTGSGGMGSPFGGSLGGPGGGDFMQIGGSPGDTDAIGGLGKEDGRAGAKAGFSGTARRVRVTHGSYNVKGGLDKETVQRYIRSKMGQVRWCYKQELQKDHKLSGTIKVKFFIGPKGRVSRIGIAMDTMGNSSVTTCIKAKVGTWRFPQSKTDVGAVVSYPFIFKPM